MWGARWRIVGGVGRGRGGDPRGRCGLGHLFEVNSDGSLKVSLLAGRVAEGSKDIPGAPTAPNNIALNFLTWSNASSGRYFPCFL